MARKFSDLRSEKKSEEPEKAPEKEPEKGTQESVETKTGEGVQDTTKQAPEESGRKIEKPWWMTGDEAKDEAKREYARNRRQPFRLWLRPEDSAEVIFLDDEGFAFWEHEVKIGGQWTPVTCLRGVDPKGCPLCNHYGRDKRYLITLRTVIDLRSFDTQNGEHREWSTKILAAKDRTNKTIERKRQLKGTLVGQKWLVHRTDAKVARCGDQFDFLEEVDVSPYKYKNRDDEIVHAAPYNYVEIYAPLEYEAVKGMIIEADQAEESSDDDAKDVPF